MFTLLYQYLTNNVNLSLLAFFMNDFALGRSCGDSGFMEDFSDMLLLKLLNTSITAADDNEKVCVYKALHDDSHLS